MATFYAGFFNLWGIPFFFLMSGATSWFSLRRRTEGRYARECVTRLLIPFIIGALVLTPIQAYYELTHKGWWDDSWCAGGQLDVLTWHARILYLLDVTQYQRLVLDVGRFLHRDTLP